jgi:3-polyprenyl-4-hydroxybenzoate decarboxylase
VTVWSGRHVILGVSGGIACYKSCYLARYLTEAGARVDVVLTRSAAEFVRPVTFEALTGRPVLVSLWDRDAALNHVRWGQQADVVIVAPATAQLIARMAQGLADDALTSVLLAATAPVLLAPAMNDEMFAHPQTQVNLALLERRGVTLVGPEIGPLAEGPSSRPGRMSEPLAIAAHAARHVVERVLGFVEVARGGVLAVEDGQILEVAVQLAADQVAEDRFAEINGPIRRSAADVLEVDGQEAWVALDQHGHGAGALGGLARAAAGIFGDIGADHDRAAILRLEGQVAQRVLQGVNAAEAGVFDLGNLAVACQGWPPAGLEPLVQHAFDDHGSGRVVGAGFGA